MTRTTSDIAASIATVEPIYDRVVALAGVLQALAQVRRIADTGEANDEILGTCCCATTCPARTATSSWRGSRWPCCSSSVASCATP